MALDSNLKKLTKLLSTAEEDVKPEERKRRPLADLFAEIDDLYLTSVKQEELMDVANGIFRAITELQQNLSNTINTNKSTGDTSIQELRTLLDTAKQEIRDLIDDTKRTNSNEISGSIKTLRAEIADVKSAIPELPDYSELFEGIEGKLTKLEEITLGENVRNALEALPDDEKLAIEAIEGLREELDKLKKASTGSFNGGGIVGRDIVTKYDLSSQLDGVTKTFNIPGTWAIISVSCSSSPNILRPVVDYTHTDSTITFTDEIHAASTLAAGQTVVLILVTA